MVAPRNRLLAFRGRTALAAGLGLVLGAALVLHPAGCGDEAECSADADCDDGVFCNGPETCGLRGRCFAAPAGPCDDRLLCTADTCDEATRSCSHVPLDLDGDTHADAACGGDDCNDEIAHVHPGAEERCDGLDNDCDGVVPEDRDGDGHFDPAVCPDGDDCDDDDPRRHPGAPEICDGIDNDCDGSVADEADSDGDTFVDATCTDGADCDDEDPAVHPAADEVCNAADDNCNGWVDELFPCVRGEIALCVTRCGSVGTGRCADDCTWAAPGACTPPDEVCGNGADDDCDGDVDEGCPTVDGGCPADAVECCDDGVDDDCDGATDEPGCRPRGGCAAGTYRHCNAGGEWGWGLQRCRADGSAWDACLEDVPAPGCPWAAGMGWDPVCCNASGACCQDTADADGDGLTRDSVGASCGPDPVCP